MRHLKWLLIIVALAPRSMPSQTTPWSAGVAKVEITPEPGLWMAGYAARTRPAQETLHPLWVKVLALQAPEGERAIVVTSDLLGFPRAFSDRVAAALTGKFQLQRSRIMLTSSHTHSGPVLSGALYDIYPMDTSQWDAIYTYSRLLESRIVQAVGAALSNMKPAVVSAGMGRALFAVNRRNNKEADVPRLGSEGVPLTGPVDHSVPVLAIRDAAGQLVAVLFGYACHATTLDGYSWSGDYPGVAQAALESAHPGAVALFHAGCGADQNPIPRRTVELVEQYGKTLAESVEQVLTQEMKPVTPALKTTFRLVELDFETELSREKFMQIASEAKNYRGQWARRQIQLLDSGVPLQKSYSYPVQAWRLGDQLWIVLGGEVVVDYALRFKKEYGPDVWVTGYANDVMAYIPSLRIQQEGGYESSSMDVYGLPSTGWARDVEDRIADAVASCVREVRQQQQ